MQTHSRSQAIVIAVAPVRFRLMAGSMALLIGAALWFGTALWFGMARAQDQEIITAHGISTFGDLKYAADFKHLDYVNPDAPKGGEISVAALGGFDSMNPYTIKGRAAGLSSGFYESLLSGTADEIGASYCLLCESMDYPKDRSWVLFTLRPGITFSDGTPLTTDDVIFSYDLFLTKGLQDFRFILDQQVEKAEVLGPTQIKFTFKPGFPTRDLPATVGGLPVMSKADYEANGRDLEESALEPFLGSAPYVLDKLDVGQSVSYKLNPDYWGRDLPINVGRNNFERIRIEYYADSNAALEGFKAGNYTFRNENSSKNWATAYDFPAVTNGAVVKAELPNGNLAPGQSWVFNLRRPQFQDPRVREAIGLMFNFEWSNQTLFYGLYARINSFWENSDLAATGLPSPGELALLEPMKDILPPGVLDLEPVTAPVSKPEQLDRASLRRASALLDEAGWAVGADGMRRNAAGETLRAEFISDDPLFDRIINPFVENLKRLGVDALLTRVDDAQYTNRDRAHDFDIINASLAQSYIPGADMKQEFGSETADVSTFNKMGLKSPAVDKLIDLALAAQSKADLAVVTKALDRVLRAEKFWVPQWYKNKHTVAYFDMFEHPEVIPPFDLGYLDFWWFNAQKAEALVASGALK